MASPVVRVASESVSDLAHLAHRTDRSHEVNPAGSQPRGVLRWGYFLVLNAISGVIAVGIFIGIFYAEGIDPYMRGTYEWLLTHPGATSLMAFSPLLASLVVGWGYSQRARKRKAAAARAAEAAAAAGVAAAP
jgi:hypothetical protein